MGNITETSRGQEDQPINRRTVIAATGSTVGAALAGCTDEDSAGPGTAETNSNNSSTTSSGGSSDTTREESGTELKYDPEGNPEIPVDITPDGWERRPDINPEDSLTYFGRRDEQYGVGIGVEFVDDIEVAVGAMELVRAQGYPYDELDLPGDEAVYVHDNLYGRLYARDVNATFDVVGIEYNDYSGTFEGSQEMAVTAADAAIKYVQTEYAQVHQT